MFLYIDKCNYLIGVGSGMTLTNAADTSTAVVTEDVGRIVRSTGSFVITKTGSVGITLAVATRVRIITMANAALEIASSVALIRILDVTLIKYF